jgi:DNA-directed RNA polymerase specialized sigma24 family protein
VVGTFCQWRPSFVRVAANRRVYRQFQAAFIDLYPVASRCAGRFFGPRGAPLADVAATETLARALDHWERVRRHHRAPEWVVLTCKDVCLELLHKEARIRAAPKQNGSPALDAALALDCLTRRARDVFVLRYMFSLPAEETARVLGWKLRKVEAIGGEARDAMRQLLSTVVDLPAIAADESPVNREDTEMYIKRLNVR